MQIDLQCKSLVPMSPQINDLCSHLLLSVAYLAVSSEVRRLLMLLAIWSESVGKNEKWKTWNLNESTYTWYVESESEWYCDGIYAGELRS